jgi:hypothetical protein
MGFESLFRRAPKAEKTPAQQQMDSRDAKVLGTLGAMAAVGLAGAAAMDQEEKAIPMDKHVMPGVMDQMPENAPVIDGVEIGKYDGFNPPTVTITGAPMSEAAPRMEGEMDHEHPVVAELEQPEPVIVHLNEKQVVIDSVEM